MMLNNETIVQAAKHALNDYEKLLEKNPAGEEGIARKHRFQAMINEFRDKKPSDKAMLTLLHDFMYDEGKTPLQGGRLCQCIRDRLFEILKVKISIPLVPARDPNMHRHLMMHALVKLKGKIARLKPNVTSEYLQNLKLDCLIRGIKSYAQAATNETQKNIFNKIATELETANNDNNESSPTNQGSFYKKQSNPIKLEELTENNAKKQSPANPQTTFNKKNALLAVIFDVVSENKSTISNAELSLIKRMALTFCAIIKNIFSPEVITAESKPSSFFLKREINKEINQIEKRVESIFSPTR